jgi:hypothetical protein
VLRAIVQLCSTHECHTRDLIAEKLRGNLGSINSEISQGKYLRDGGYFLCKVDVAITIFSLDTRLHLDNFMIMVKICVGEMYGF